MKLLDKLKNALFEEEYVEVEEKPKKKELKREKVRKEEPVKPSKPIAKKIVQPERKEPIIRDEDTELLDEDFEIKKHEEKKEFKFPVMDEDFRVDEAPVVKKEKKIDEELSKKEVKEIKRVEKKQEKEKKSKPYGLDDFEIPEKEHGLYEKKEERTYFKPSPIISPIYGILDKNYKKDDIRDKKEIRLTSSYAKENLDFDEVRKKAYGSLADDIEKEFEDISDEIEEDIEETDPNPLLDLSAAQDMPQVKKVTVGDAEEYFEDLGLEYNVDYKDISKEKATGRRVQQQNYEEDIEIDEEEETPQVVPKPEIEEEKEVVIKEDTETQEDIDDDNLFDLIDSMYDQ